jgi:ABC-type branched-subunit amino acid transport system substrate-binding protein
MSSTRSCLCFGFTISVPGFPIPVRLHCPPMTKTICRLVALILLSVAPVSAQEPGAIRIGTLAYPNGPLTEVSQAMHAALKAYLDEINSKGGVNGRKLELSVATVEKDFTVTTANMRRLIRDERVIAFVGGMIAGSDMEIAAFAQTEEVPLIGPATLDPPVGPSFNRYGFYAVSGVREQARALVNFAAARPGLKNSPAAIIYFDDKLNTASAAAAEEQAKQLGWSSVSKSLQTATAFTPAQIASDIKQKGVQVVFVFGSSSATRALIEQSIQAGVTPAFFAVGATANQETFAALSPAFQDKFFLSFPIVPADLTAAAEYQALRTKYQLPAKHIASQFSTLAAAKVFIEGLKGALEKIDLKQAGDTKNQQSVSSNPKPQTQDLKLLQQKLIESLEGLRDFETGFTPRVSFSPTRRIGAMGAYMVTFDSETKQLVPASGWVPVN